MKKNTNENLIKVNFSRPFLFSESEEPDNDYERMGRTGKLLRPNIEIVLPRRNS